jgi:hypothetical protein
MSLNPYKSWHSFFVKADSWEDAVEIQNEQQAEEWAAALCIGLPDNITVVRSDGELIHEFFKE